MKHGKLTAEQERRVRELHNMDQATYDVLLERVRHSLYNPEIADDAMQYAYEQALKVYDGRVPYANFMLRVAHNYAYDEWVNHGKRELLISEIEERDPELQSVGVVEDVSPDYAEVSFADEILKALIAMEADPFVAPAALIKVERTRSMFDELLRAAIAGYGPGVDEYEEQTEQEIPEGSARRVRRTNMLEHLAAVMTRKENAGRKLTPGSKAKPYKQVGVKSVEASMTLLRKITRPIVYDDPPEENFGFGGGRST